MLAGAVTEANLAGADAVSLAVAASILGILAVVGGAAGLQRLAPDVPLAALTRLAASWLVGQLLISAGAACCLLLRVDLVWALAVPLAAAALLRRADSPTALGSPPPEPHRPDLWLRGLAAAFALLTLTAALRTPGLGWDGLAIWGQKARTLAETGTIPWADWTHPAAVSIHPEYPLHVPLLGAVFGRLVELLGGAWGDPILPLLAALDVAGVAALLAGAWEGQSRTRRPAAAILLTGGLLTPLVWRELPEGKADLTLAFCVLATVIAASTWLRTGRTGALTLAAVAGGLGACTKQEGLVWLVLTAALAFLITPSTTRRAFLGPGVLALAIAAPWHGVRLVMGIATEPFSFELRAARQLPRVLKAFGSELVDVSHWGVLWVATAAAASTVLLGLRRRPTLDGDARADAFEVSLVAAGLAALVAIFLATPHDLDWHLATALDRVLLPLWPPALLVVAAGLRAASDFFDQRWQRGQ